MTRDRVHYIPRGWGSSSIGFCPGERAWRREMKRLGCANAPAYPKSAGCCLEFDSGTGGLIIVTFSEAADKTTPIELIGLIAHEATHVVQKCCKFMQDDSPSLEFEAYGVQAITQSLLMKFIELRRPDLFGGSKKRAKVSRQ